MPAPIIIHGEADAKACVTYCGRSTMGLLYVKDPTKMQGVARRGVRYCKICKRSKQFKIDCLKGVKRG